MRLHELPRDNGQVTRRIAQILLRLVFFDVFALNGEEGLMIGIIRN
jgi:hypothetical protein